MRKISTLIGMPVVVGNRRLGRVVQAQLSSDLTQLEGLWVDAGIRGTRYLPSDRLSMVGSVVVMADDIGRRGRCRTGALFLRAVGTDGRRLGAITGAEIDELSFAVISLELSCGLIDDLLYGRRRITRFTRNRENDSVVIGAAASDEKEDGCDEKRNGEGPDHRCSDRRIRCDDVRCYELAECAQHEPQDEEDRPLDRRKDR